MYNQSNGLLYTTLCQADRSRETVTWFDKSGEACLTRFCMRTKNYEEYSKGGIYKVVLVFGSIVVKRRRSNEMKKKFEEEIGRF